MNRTCFYALIWLAVTALSSAAAGGTMFIDIAAADDVPPSTNASAAVNGEMVDAEVPTTYRLPLPAHDAPLAGELNTGTPLFSPPPCQTDETIVDRSIQLPMAPAAENPPVEVRVAQLPFTAPVPASVPPALGGGDFSQFAEDGIAAEASVGVRQTLQPSDAVAPEILFHTPTTVELTKQLMPAVQRGYGLAQRGALFAARTEFVQVLRRVAQAQDAAANTGSHSRALAAGLRALAEADDFVPSGVQLEAELDVRVTASSHRTHVLNDQEDPVLPHEAVALYHTYAEQKLAEAAAGEQAGSMALYGLGQIYARLAERKDDDVHFVRSAITMYAAALAACPDNHLAANELGVLLCRTGRSADAVRQFQKAIDFAPSATAYHNLAVAQRKLGMNGEAQANEQESTRLASWERASGSISRRAGIEWVAPAEMARVSQSATWTSAAPAVRPAAHSAQTPRQRRWR